MVFIQGNNGQLKLEEPEKLYEAGRLGSEREGQEKELQAADHCVKGQCLDLCWGAGVPRLKTKLEAQSWKPLKSSGPSIFLSYYWVPGTVRSTLKRIKKERTLVQTPFTNSPCPGKWVISTTAEE